MTKFIAGLSTNNTRCYSGILKMLTDEHNKINDIPGTDRNWLIYTSYMYNSGCRKVLSQLLKARQLVEESKSMLSVKLDCLGKAKGFSAFWLKTLSS
jgi:hypothetical protein